MTTFVLKNLRRLFDKYAVARTEHDALVKSTMKIFSNFVAFSENPNFKRLWLFRLHISPLHWDSDIKQNYLKKAQLGSSKITNTYLLY